MATAATAGLTLPGFKSLAPTDSIGVAAAPDLAVLPLNQHTGAPAVPLVRVGERVLLGQRVADADEGVSACLHSPVSGRVIAIEPRPAPHVGGAATPTIVVENDGSDERAPPVLDPGTALALEPNELRERIHAAGIVGLGGAVFPTGIKVTPAPGRPVERLVINAAECEPYISCDQAALTLRAPELIHGAAVLLHALESDRCTIAVEADKEIAVRAVRHALEEAADPRFELRLLRPVYPSGAERQLITLLTGHEVPSSGVPGDIGFVCHNVGTALAVAQLAQTGTPLIDRIVTVTGHGIRAPANLSARLGTRFAALIDCCGGYTEDVEFLIMGGSMMGTTLPHDDLPLVKGTNCIIAAAPADLAARTAEMPCIRCGDCAAVCPAGLLPQQLHWHVRDRDLDALERFGLDDCIECGCCDYVCPSQIPLTTRFRSAKGLLHQREDARDRADRARARFEARARRLEAQAEARARRLEQKRQAVGRQRRGDGRPPDGN
jgi:electron transport complex protein RnfC